MMGTVEEFPGKTRRKNKSKRPRKPATLAESAMSRHVTTMAANLDAAACMGMAMGFDRKVFLHFAAAAFDYWHDPFDDAG